MVIRAMVITTVEQKDYTGYTIMVSTSESSWSFTTRYSEITELKSALKKEGHVLPELPGKHFFGSKSAKVIHQRRLAIDDVLAALVKMPQHPAVRSFLMLDRNVDVSTPEVPLY